MTAALRARPGLILLALAIVIGLAAAIRADVTTGTLTHFTLIAVLAMVLGEQVPMKVADRIIAPLTIAPALGLILNPDAFDGQPESTCTVLVLVWLSILAGGLIARARGLSVVEGSLGARFLGLAVTTMLARRVSINDTTLLEWAFGAHVPRADVAALTLLAVATVGGLVERVLTSLVAWLGEGQPWCDIIAHERGALAGISAVAVASGPLIAVAHPVVGWAAIPLLLLPVLLSYVAVGRLVTIRGSLEQSVLALSRLTEVAGVTRPGHSRRVTRLAVRIGTEMEVDAPTLRRIERTALLHDLGRLGPTDPRHRGRSLHVGPETEDLIAATGGRIVGANPQLEYVLPLLTGVRTPFRRSREFGEDIPLESRIVRVANAWHNTTEGSPSPRAEHVALERLHLGLGYDYDPEVVAALERTLT